MKCNLRILKPMLILIILCAKVQAQSFVDKMLTHRVVVHYPDHVVNAHVKPGREVSIHNDRFYYWFSGNEISVTQGGYSGKLLNGDYEDLYPNKSLRASGVFDRGLKTGIWKSWSEDGRLRNWYMFNRGRKNGRYCIYDTAGTIIAKGRYRNDVVKPRKNIIPKFLYKLLPKKKLKPNTK